MDKGLRSNSKNKKRPTVSVIMNCLNGSEYLCEAIDSVYNQTYDDWEMVFWDNASTDKSAEIAKSYDGRLKYFRSDRTVLLGEARNWAVEQASGKYLTFLDCDDVWFATKLQKQVDILNKNDKIALLYSNYFRLYPNKKKELVLKGSQPSGNVFESFLRFYPVGILTVMLRKETLRALEMIFDKNINNTEEYDLFMRLLYKNEAAYMNEPLANYRIHGNMESIKTMNRYPDELTYIIEKFKKMDLGFEQKYNLPLKSLHSEIDYSRAKIELLEGDSTKARKIIRNSKQWKRKFFVLYLLTFVPKVILSAIRRFRGKYILRNQ